MSFRPIKQSAGPPCYTYIHTQTIAITASDTGHDQTQDRCWRFMDVVEGEGGHGVMVKRWAEGRGGGGGVALAGIMQEFGKTVETYQDRYLILYA